jgi:hypothetical protein
MPLVGEPGRAAQQLGEPDLLLLDLARCASADLLSSCRALAAGPAAQLEQAGGQAPPGPAQLPPVFLATLDQDQGALTEWWCAATAAPRAVVGGPGCGRTRAVANLAANAVARGGQVPGLVLSPVM